jgi:hypothetical protein
VSRKKSLMAKSFLTFTFYRIIDLCHEYGKKISFRIIVNKLVVAQLRLGGEPTRDI